MWSEKARSFRKPNKRGVSPIIATILLVAITVVLAAVLYILISGFTKGPGNTPLGTAFTFGTPGKTTGTASTPGCASGHLCYNLAVGSAGGGITASSLNFVIRDVNGNAVSALNSAATVSVVSSAPAVIATYTISSASWTSGTSTTGLSTTQTIVLDLGCTPTGCTVNPTGDVIVALGVGSYSGQVSQTLN